MRFLFLTIPVIAVVMVALALFAYSEMAKAGQVTTMEKMAWKVT